MTLTPGQVLWPVILLQISDYHIYYYSVSSDCLIDVCIPHYTGSATVALLLSLPPDPQCPHDSMDPEDRS